MNKEPKYGFTIVSNFEDLAEAKKQNDVQVAVFCLCCNRQKITDLDNAYLILFNNQKLTEK